MTPAARASVAATFEEIVRRRHPGCDVTVVWPQTPDAETSAEQGIEDGSDG